MPRRASEGKKANSGPPEGGCRLPDLARDAARGNGAPRGWTGRRGMFPACLDLGQEHKLGGRGGLCKKSRILRRLGLVSVCGERECVCVSVCVCLSLSLVLAGCSLVRVF